MIANVKKWLRRKYQKVAIVAARKVRTMFLLWARQCRKSTTLGDLAFDSMSKAPGRTVIAASASLLTAAELVSKTITSAEQAILVTREADAMRKALDQSTDEAGGKLKLVCANAETGKVYASLNEDDYRDLYASKRLEMRLHFTRSDYSRLLIIAPNPATARGWTGDVFRDEALFTAVELERDLRIAVKPIMDTDPSFRMFYASNLCKEDRHPGFEQTLPEPGAEFPVNPSGNFYRGQDGILIHRVALVDAYAAGHVLYDDREGKPLTYEQFLAAPANKLGLNGSYLLNHEFGGTAAIDFLALNSAQRRGAGQCMTFHILSDSDFETGLRFLAAMKTPDVCGVGIDPATTTREISNPTALTVTYDTAGLYCERAVFLWKEKNPKIARDRIRRILQLIAPRRACIDATGEAYFARETADDLGALCPWELVDARVKVEPVPPGYERDPIYKTWTGDRYSGMVNDNRLVCPGDEYYKDDHRMVVKTGGLYACEPDPRDGKHGDTFDSGKLALHALTSNNGAIESVTGWSFGQHANVRGGFKPRHLPRKG
jgi:hypothetical protein